MITNALDFLIHAILGLLVISFMLRFLFQLTGASFRNPFAQTILTMTNFAVIPTRRIIPSLKKIDLSTLVLSYLTQFAIEIVSLLLHDFPLTLADKTAWVGLLGIALVALLKLTISIFFYATIAQAILSWVNPYTPVAPILYALTEPLLQPIRRLLPTPSGIDFSPFVLCILTQLILNTVMPSLDQLFVQML